MYRLKYKLREIIGYISSTILIFIWRRSSDMLLLLSEYKKLNDILYSIEEETTAEVAAIKIVRQNEITYKGKKRQLSLKIKRINVRHKSIHNPAMYAKNKLYSIISTNITDLCLNVKKAKDIVFTDIDKTTPSDSTLLTLHSDIFTIKHIKTYDPYKDIDISSFGLKTQEYLLGVSREVSIDPITKDTFCVVRDKDNNFRVQNKDVDRWLALNMIVDSNLYL